MPGDLLIVIGCRIGMTAIELVAREQDDFIFAVFTFQDPLFGDGAAAVDAFPDAFIHERFFAAVGTGRDAASEIGQRNLPFIICRAIAFTAEAFL